ncbi:MAG TPA: hypothetical protein VGW34_05295 [Allosphingosinicella sp.]|nr:hypothetical protein [Allosphingosinicella sp.]
MAARSTRRYGWLWPALLLGSGTAPAQELATAGAAGSDIVVTGTREPRRTLAEFVAAASDDHNGQLARFYTAICPASLGLPEGLGAAIADRVRDIAGAAGIEVAKPGCRPNLLVVVAERGRDFAAAFRDKRPALFRQLGSRELSQLLDTDEPVRAWQLVRLREADGRRAEPFVEGPGYVLDAHLMPSHSSSRLQKSMQPGLAMSFIVFDIGAIEGLTLTQLADHAAMRTLARTRSTAAGARSILGLFEDRRAGRRPARALTPRDLAYLKALYRTHGTRTAAQQRRSMARMVERQLAGTRASERPRR